MATPNVRLTTRQDAILAFVRRFVGDYRYPPTVREIAAELAISSTSVVIYNLRVLARLGLIRRSPIISPVVPFSRFFNCRPGQITP